MKKLINKTTAYLLCATALLSCVKEVEPSLDNSDESIVPEGYVLQTFSAVSEQTKTSIVSGNTVWNEEDKILTLCTDGTVTDPFSLVEGAGTTAGKFQGLVPDGKTVSCAIYPHDVYSSASETTVSVSIASEQPGTFAAGNIAVAKVDAENELSFKNVNSFLVFQLKAGSEVTKVVVTSVDGSPLAGTIAVDCSGEVPAAGDVSDPSASVSMTTDGEGIYYMSIVSGITHAQGLKMTYYSGEEETGVYYFNRNLKIAVNMMYQLGEVETDGNYYVTVEGAGSCNGMNWANAFSQADMWKRISLSDAHSDETNEAKFEALDGATFHMAAGTYDWGADALISIDKEEQVSFTVKGGYDPSTSERNLETNATVFTGKSEHQIFTLGGNMDVEFDGVNFVDGNSEGKGGAIYITSGSWSFKDCNFTGNIANYGGAVRSETEGNLAFERTIFAANEARKDGGALALEHGTVTIADCNFNENIAYNDRADRESGDGLGGAIDVFGDADLEIIGGAFTGNVAWDGAAVCVEGTGDVKFENVSFEGNGNENTRNAGAVSAHGKATFNDCIMKDNVAMYGAGVCVHKNSAITIRGGEFNGNAASTNGGAIHVVKGGELLVNSKSAEFVNNSAKSYGGAINIESGSSKIENKINKAIFKGNTSKFGGAVAVDGVGGTTKVYFNSCTFGGTEEGDFNSSTKGGGAIYAENDNYVNVGLSNFICNYAGNNGGAIYIKADTYLDLFRNSFDGNYANSGGAIYTENTDAKYPRLWIDECSFDANYIINNYGAAINVNGIDSFCMHNSSVRGSYTTNTSSTNKKDLKPCWISIDGVQASSSISNCSIIGDVRRLKSDGVSFEILTTNTSLVGVWGSAIHYFTNNIIVPESDGVASIGVEGGTPVNVNLNYTHYNKLINVISTENGGNVSGYTATDFDGLTWSNDASTTYYWKWNGTINEIAPALTSQSDVSNRVNGICSGFVSWSGSDFNMDQRNLARSGDWWPGAYQGTVDTENVYLKFTTYNILKPEGRREEMSMDKAEVRQTLAETIASTQSDIIGFGELDETLIPNGKYDLEALCSSIPNYTWSLDWPNEISRSGFVTYTYSTSCNYSEGFAYNNQKLELIESGYVWLSKTEEKWYEDAKNAYGKVGNPDRTCVCTKFRHKGSGKIFWVFITHLPTEDQGGMENMAKVVNKFAQQKAGNAPAILIGDMNANPDSQAYATLTNYWDDGNSNVWGTLSGSSTKYYYSVKTMSDGRNDRRIDHILTKGCEASAYQRTVITYEVDENDWCPSDHLPVTAKVAIP